MRKGPREGKKLDRAAGYGNLADVERTVGLDLLVIGNPYDRHIG